jgi:hypothetical protein
MYNFLKEKIIKNKNIILAGIIYFLVAVVFTYPLIFNFNHLIYAQGGDPYGTLHFFWWLKDHSANYFFPNSPLYTLFGKYLTICFGEIAAYNILTFLGFILTGIAGYILVKKITKNNLAGFFSGLILSIAPFRIAHAMQHMTFVDLSLILFFIYFLIRSKEELNLKNVIVSAIFFVLITLYNYQYGFFAGIILLIFAIYFLLCWLVKNKFRISNFKPKIKSIIYIIIAFLFSVIIIGFFNYNLVRDLFAVKNQEKVSVSPVRNYSELDTYSARWFYYFTPSPENPFFGKNTNSLYSKIIDEKGTNLTEQTLYLGWVSILLTIFAIWQIIKKTPAASKFGQITGFLIITGLVGMLFSFAPEITVLGHQIKTPAYYIFPHLPFFRVYARFGLLMVISVSILAGIGLSLLLDKIKSKIFSSLIFVIICTLSIIEFINIPPLKTIDVSENSMPQVYQYLKNQPSGLVAEYPLFSSETPFGYEYLLWQRYHQMPLIYGDSVNTSGDDFRKTVLNPYDTDTIQRLKDAGVKYIIVHSNLYNNYAAKFFPIEDNYGLVPIINSPFTEFVANYYGDIIYRIK